VLPDVKNEIQILEIPDFDVIQRSGGCFVVPLPVNPEFSSMEILFCRVIHNVGSEAPKAVIFDVSATKLMDSQIAGQINRAASTLRLLGSQVFLSGLSPELCSALIRLNVSFPALQKSGTLDYAFEVVGQSLRSKHK